MLRPDIKPIADSIVDRIIEKLSNNLSDMKVLLGVEVMELLNPFADELGVVLTHTPPQDPRSVPQSNSPQRPPRLDGIVPSPSIREEGAFAMRHSWVEGQSSSVINWPCVPQIEAVKSKATLSWRANLLTLLDVERVSLPVVWNGWGVFSTRRHPDGNRLPRLMGAIVISLILLTAMFWEMVDHFCHGFVNQAIKMEMCFDAIFRFGTLAALLCYLFGHHAHKALLGPGHELDLMEALLLQSCAEPCECDGLSEYRSFFIVLSVAVAAISSVIFGFNNEHEAGRERAFFSIGGFSCAAAVHLALLFRVTWCFQRLRRILLSFGCHLVARGLCERTGRVAVHQWCALEAACRCFSLSYSPVLFFMLLIPPVQVLAVVVSLSTHSNVTMVSCVGIIPYLVLFAGHIGLVYTICDVNRLGREIPQLVTSQMASNFLQPQFNQFIHVLRQCTVEISCFGFRMDFATVTRGLYMGVVVLLTSWEKWMADQLV